MTFDAPPKAKVADVKAALGKYKVEEVKLKFTAQAPEGTKLDDLTLTGDDVLKELKDLQGKKVVLTGILTDGEGGRNLKLTKVSEAK